MKKRIIAAINAIIMLIALCGCSGEKSSVKRFDDAHEKVSSAAFVASENDSFSLSWDSEHYRVILTDKKNGTVWSALPSGLHEVRYDEDGFEENNHPHTESPLTIEYVDPNTLQVELLYAYTGSLKRGDYAIEKTDNGIKLTYYFSKQGISVSVEYKLLADGINISVDPNEITENDEYIYRLILAPFFASASNTSASDYLFVPSGSGALIYPKDWSADTPYTLSYPVYGTDLAAENKENGAVNNVEPVRLPVFGAKQGDNAVCAIIEDGAECASIECSVGNTQYGYSSVYAAFQLRGFSSNSYSKNVVSEKLSVSYYPLSGEEADYVGIANRYRKYLTEKYQLKRNENDTALSVKLIGGTHISSQVLGVPYEKLLVTTSLEEAADIVKDIYEHTNISPAVNLVGYGTSGLDTDKIAGGFEVGSKFGEKKQLTALSDFCNNIGSSLFFDYDIIYFANSGGGIRKMFDYAVTPVGQRTIRYKTEFGTGSAYSNKEYFVAREKLVEIGTKAAQTTSDFGLTGISYNTASSGAYSDYAERKYYVKSGFAENYTDISETVKKKGLSLLADNANDYAAAVSSIVTCAPTQSAQNDLFTFDVPFYQIVFKGYVPMTSDAVNLEMNPELAVLRAAEAGTGLSYTLIAHYDKSLMTSKQTVYHSAVFEGVSDKLYQTVRSYSEYFDLIKNTAIKTHTILENGIRKTVFENGVTVYVNYSGNTLHCEHGTVDGYSYLYTRGEAK